MELELLSPRRRRPPYASARSINCRRYRERFVSKQLRPAIAGKSCAICLRSRIEGAAVITACMHAYCTSCIRKWSKFKRKCPLCNANISSLFVGIHLSSGTFRTERLPVLSEDCKSSVLENHAGDSRGRHRDFVAQQRVIRKSREDLNIVNRRTRPLPTRRSFGQSKLLPPGVINERILQWRVSIYEKNLRAVPCSNRSSLQQGITGRNGYRERLLQRIEPWIHRELHAILGDPDLGVLVHVVTSLFITSLEEKRKVPSGQCNEEDNYLDPLRTFLLERTGTFWHELSSFAESSFNMETYDTVVEYVKWTN